MDKQNTLTKINLYDKFNSAFVSIITPEMRLLNKVRKQNNYSKTPTLEQPFEMPLEYFTLAGTQIRMAKSRIEGENRR